MAGGLQLELAGGVLVAAAWAVPLTSTMTLSRTAVGRTGSNFGAFFPTDLLVSAASCLTCAGVNRMVEPGVDDDIA